VLFGSPEMSSILPAATTMKGGRSLRLALLSHVVLLIAKVVMAMAGVSGIFCFAFSAVEGKIAVWHAN
jgi:hypothetical protein